MQARRLERGSLFRDLHKLDKGQETHKDTQTLWLAIYALEVCRNTVDRP